MQLVTALTRPRPRDRTPHRSFTEAASHADRSILGDKMSAVRNEAGVLEVAEDVCMRSITINEDSADNMLALAAQIFPASDSTHYR